MGLFGVPISIDYHAYDPVATGDPCGSWVNQRNPPSQDEAGRVYFNRPDLHSDVDFVFPETIGMKQESDPRHPLDKLSHFSFIFGQSIKTKSGRQMRIKSLLRTPDEFRQDAFQSIAFTGRHCPLLLPCRKELPRGHPNGNFGNQPQVFSTDYLLAEKLSPLVCISTCVYMLD